MDRYNKSSEFERLEKLADLEKRILGNIEDTKDDTGSSIIPRMIRNDLNLRGSCPIPKEILDHTIDDGMEETISHLHKHKAMMLPGEALYHAIGKKDTDTYNSAMNMGLGDILKMIINRAAVSQTMADKPMHIDDFDVPKHIKIIVRIRGVAPDMLEKSARDKLGTLEMLDGLQLTYMTGKKEIIGAKFAKEHKANLEMLVNDGVIIKVVKILSSGMKTTIIDKTASSDTDDMLYAEMINGSIK